jgi:hypothetical protein
MRFMQLQGFDVRPDKSSEFQRWIIANDARIRKAYPSGTEYGGCYATVFSSEKQAGSVVWIEILDSYGALDTLAAAGKDPSHPLAQVQEELIRFFDPRPTASWSKTLLKDVLDVTVSDMPTE